MTYKIGSLFDGSGGFPLAATMCGIEPVWASEIEPYPIAVTKSRFPNMKHLGSITDINGAEVEPVDIITFGSPCQDLSVAGKRAGLKHTENGDDETTRSGLFMEAVRIIKEMRKATNGEYPRYAVWENVPGAFSSNKGGDFRVVLEELIRIAEPTAVMPDVPKAGWSYADVYCGDGWSLAYRVLDAQYWGVPQRRRRIYLVADFRGQRAGKILFEREGLRGNLAQSGAAWQAVAGDAEGGIGADDREGAVRDVIPINTMIATRHKQLGRGTGFGVGEVGEPQFTISSGHEHAVAYTLKIRSGCEGGGKGALVQTDMSATLATNNDQYLFQPVSAMGFDMYNQQSTGDVVRTLKTPVGGDDLPVICMATQQGGAEIMEDKCPTITAAAGMSGNNQPVICLQGNGIDRADTAGCNGKGWKEDTCYTLNTIDRPAVAYGMETFHCTSEEEKAPTLKARDWKDPHVVAYWDGTQICGTLTANNAGGNQRMPDKENFNCVIEEDPIAIDRAYFNQGQNDLYDPQLYADGTNPTLVARGPNAVAVRYIVRRLTPTECARLQGFPDNHGHPDIKDSFTDEEYSFWLNVRNTHASINGKATKEYTKEQMLTWYNKLHTDSSEYKMWGNGIALPCALYVMEGIANGN